MRTKDWVLLVSLLLLIVGIGAHDANLQLGTLKKRLAVHQVASRKAPVEKCPCPTRAKALHYGRETVPLQVSCCPVQACACAR